MNIQVEFSYYRIHLPALWFPSAQTVHILPRRTRFSSTCPFTFPISLSLKLVRGENPALRCVLLFFGPSPELSQLLRRTHTHTRETKWATFHQFSSSNAAATSHQSSVLTDKKENAFALFNWCCKELSGGGKKRRGWNGPGKVHATPRWNGTEKLQKHYRGTMARLLNSFALLGLVVFCVKWVECLQWGCDF